MPPKSRHRKTHTAAASSRLNATSGHQTDAQLSSEEVSLLKACAEIFAPTLALPENTLTAAIQQVKSALYDRNYALAFSTDVHCKAYCARWIPSRALIYRRLLSRLEWTPEQVGQTQWILLGGGPGSELLALATLSSPTATLHTVAVDSADWSACHQAYLDHFAQEEEDNDNKTTVRELKTPKLDSTLRQVDMLDATAFSQLLATLPPRPHPDAPRFVTLFFTLHELLLASRAKTVAMLRQLTDVCRPRDQLLVVESASLGTVSLGEKKTEYSLTWLLEHLLLAAGDWTLESDMSADKEWYRLPTQAALQVYPIKLENTRVLVRLFTKL